MWIIGVWQSNNLSLLTFNHREFTCYDCSSSTSAIWSLHKTFFMWAWDCNALYIPTSFLISCFITLLTRYVTCLLLDSGLDVLIWMGMDCSRQTNCSTFTRSSCIGWSAWPKSLCYLRMYYARLLTWLDRRSVLVFSRTHLCLSLIVSSMIMLFLMWLVVIHNVIYRIKATSLCATWKAANFREMFSIFFSISTSSLLLKAVTLFLFVR